MRLCFVVNSVRTQRPTYTTAHLAFAAARRGHEVAFVSVDALSIGHGNDGDVFGDLVRPKVRRARDVATYGNVNAVSDAGVAAWLARSGVEGAALNVRINLGDVPEQERAGFQSRLEKTLAEARELHAACVAEVDRRMRAA